MKVLSVQQPWASLLAHSIKHCETRSWCYRGDLPAVLAIHASKRIDEKIVSSLVHDEGVGWHFRTALSQMDCAVREFEKSGHYAVDCSPLPLGSVVAVARLVACVSTVPLLNEMAWKGLLTSRERAFGDYTPGRYGWIFDKVYRLPEPIPARGCLYLWDWDAPAELVKWEREAVAELLAPGPVN